jgi:ABC-type sugar transport system substrate-binding protein/CheY-like chemotaxis protein/AraC-like DNA-binding protein/nitrogen-specific signal transduction histidine kinase
LSADLSFKSIATMKRILTIFFPFILLLLSSCSNEKTSRIKVIGVSQCSDDAWRRTMNSEMKREASFNPGIEIRIQTAHDSNQKQIRDIENFIADKVDLIIVSPNEAIPLTPVIEKAMLEGIPVVLVDRKISSGKYTAFVGADNLQIGKEVGVYTANLLKGKGNIAEIRGLDGSTPALERHRGFMNVIEKYTDIHVVFQCDGGWLRKQAKEKMSRALHQNIQIDLVFAHNDEMATGAREAITSFNGIKKPVLLGIDALPGTDGGIQKVISGILDATFIYPTGGEKAIQTAVRILNNESFKRDNILYTAVVDKTNARVLKLQTDQIIEHQNRIGQLNSVLDKNLAKYSSQRILLLSSLFILFLITVLLILLIRAYSSKNKSNIILEQQNVAINKQKEELSSQRDQLIVLSKNLEEATQAKLVFFTNISHEFRTPLTLILGPLDSLIEKETLSENGKRLVQLMRKNVYVLLKLIDQIIDFRKYENGKMQMFFTLSDLKYFIAELSNSFIEFSKKKHIHFTFTSADDDFTLWFDTDKMEKICYNLLSNAFKFTPENGRIDVNLSKIMKEDESFAQLTVSDNGGGISEHHLQSIFERFYKVDSRTTGSGIGLHLTKVLVEMHNGTIGLKSEEGKGSVFTVQIPFKQKEIPVVDQYPKINTFKNREDDMLILDAEEEIDEKVNLQTDKPLVLIVEDNVDVRTYIKSLLIGDFEIIEASNGQTGFLKAMKFVPELIITDVSMDVMDGFELCKQVKENLSTSHIPVILLTAYALDEQRAIGFESGADAYISKPFNENLLKIRARKLIENRENVKLYFQKNLTFGDRKENVAEIDKSFITKFRKLIEDKLIDSDLNVDEIGKNMGLSRVQLYRKIKSLTNYAPNELVRIIRLKASEQLLIKTEKSISEIAYETGFSSPSYFTKCYKEYFTESPTEFLKRIK